jgi:hypothetical protein
MTVIWDADQPPSGRMARERLDYQVADGEDSAYTTVMPVMVVLWEVTWSLRAVVKIALSTMRQYWIVRGLHSPCFRPVIHYWMRSGRIPMLGLPATSR